MARLSSCAELATISRIGSNLLDFMVVTTLSARWRRWRRELRHEFVQIRITSFEAHRLVHVLAQELQYFRPLLHGKIDARIGASPVCADRDQIAILLVDGIHLFEPHG